MDSIVLDTIPWQLRIDDVFQKLRMDPSDPDADAVQHLLATAHRIGQPKAAYKESYIETKGEDTVVVDGVLFTSRVLRVNLEEAHRVFAYLGTCGTELEQWAAGLTDMLERYWADAIMELALREALRFLTEEIGRAIPHVPTSVMNPGSLHSWPITEQRPLFALIGPGAQAIGVRLTDSMLMLPAKSVSGIRFPTETSFESCQLCPRETCPGRRAPYDSELYLRRYANGR